jgi:hypothetical protein
MWKNVSDITLSLKRRVQNGMHSLGQVLFLKCHRARASICASICEHESVVKESQHCWTDVALIYVE